MIYPEEMHKAILLDNAGSSYNALWLL